MKTNRQAGAAMRTFAIAVGVAAIAVDASETVGGAAVAAPSGR